ncbi:uncharacterized membrane protein YebE (DUF533 family) [Lactobacillus colini]|uniref:Uncharacterized membrane protein YebE (DUF533 family) n=1 Tax=Lactobacillus colini TaxID=1819254 RepID=A0ABS4MG42_9LACO|nr:hypothetical protein [Lactobacillus colini]MBP2058660.1 uncharacterized membrane protein YebE (DUF533 family) [Lactobacillus colini]
MSKSTWKLAAGITGTIAGLGAVAYAAKKAIDYYKNDNDTKNDELKQQNKGPTISNEVVDLPEAAAYADRNDVEYGESPYNPAN